MSDHIHFEGDPSTDSTRRRLERLMHPPQPRRRWPLALMAGGTAWGLWRLVQAIRSRRPELVARGSSAARDGSGWGGAPKP